MLFVASGHSLAQKQRKWRATAVEGKEAERECKLELTSRSRFACCCLGAPPFPPFQLAQGVVEAKLYRKDVAKRHTVILGCLVCPGCWEMETQISRKIYWH